jgi:O-antigen/teichoic acid export membrane protein
MTRRLAVVPHELQVILTRAGGIAGMRVIHALANAVAGIITARALGPDGKGALAILVLLPRFVTSLAGLGLSSALVYHRGVGKIGGRQLYAVAYLASGILGTVAVVVTYGLAAVGLLAAFLGQVPVHLALLSSLGVPLLLLYGHLNQALLADQLFTPYTIAIGMQPVLYTLALGGTWVLGALHGPADALILWWVSVAAATLYSAVAGYRRYRQDSRQDWPGVAPLLHFGLRSYLPGIVQLVNLRLDSLLVNFFLSPAAVGLYTAAVGLAELLFMVPESASTVLQARSAHRGDIGHSIQSVKLATLALMVLALGMAVLGRPLVTIFYGAAFAPATEALLLLLPGVVFLGIQKALTGMVVGGGRPEMLIPATVVGLVMTIIGDITLIPVLGIAGAALASSLSYIASSAIFMWQVWTRLHQGTLFALGDSSAQPTGMDG